MQRSLPLLLSRLTLQQQQPHCRLTQPQVMAPSPAAAGPCDSFTAEVNIMCRLSHHSLFVRVFGSVDAAGHVLEKCQCGVRIVERMPLESGWCKDCCLDTDDWRLKDCNIIVMGECAIMCACLSRTPAPHCRPQNAAMGGRCKASSRGISKQKKTTRITLTALNLRRPSWSS